MKIYISPDYKDSFKDELHVMNQWRLVVTVTVKYLGNIDSPATNWKFHYTTMTPTATNHNLADCSYPKLVSLATGETNMLL